MLDRAPRIVARREVPPDPSIARAVGRHHTFETAIADLVDNSLDAGAKHVLIRFLQRDGGVVGLQIIDDGTGMDATSLDDAMIFAKKRRYGGGALGHFGLGMKAASLSQADALRVYSRRFGAQPAGRMITASEPTMVNEIDVDDAEALLLGLSVDFSVDCGTVLEWVEPRTFLSSTDSADRARWLEERISAVLSHLGIVFHRLLSESTIELSIDVFDIGSRMAGVPRRVNALDPFGYRNLPHAAFPADLIIDLGGDAAHGTLHVWPAAQSGSPAFRLGGKPGTLFQGFYFYRNKRLLQIGGWNTLTVSRPELEYARVAVDLNETLSKHLTINPEKAGLELDADAKRAILASVYGESRKSFASFLDAAQDARREARRYTKRPVELVKPSRGFGAEIREAFEESVDFVRGGSVDIRWEVMATESPFRVDLDERTIWLNEQYRSVIAGRDSQDNDDVPLVKTLLLLVFSKYFEGSHLGSRERLELCLLYTSPSPRD